VCVVRRTSVRASACQTEDLPVQDVDLVCNAARFACETEDLPVQDIDLVCNATRPASNAMHRPMSHC